MIPVLVNNKTKNSLIKKLKPVILSSFDILVIRAYCFPDVRPLVTATTPHTTHDTGISE